MELQSSLNIIILIQQEKIIVDDVEDQAKSLLDVNPEGALSMEIKDILDELHIMLNIKIKQQRVLKEFQKHVEYILAPALAISKNLGTARQTTLTSPGRINTTSRTENASESTSATSNEQSNQLEGGKSSNQVDAGAAAGSSEMPLHDLKAEKDAKWTMEFALRLAGDLSNRITDLTHLREAAEQTEKAVSCPSLTRMAPNSSDSNLTGGWSTWIEAATGRSSPGSRSCEIG
jgi:hypothetical protein